MLNPRLMMVALAVASSASLAQSPAPPTAPASSPAAFGTRRDPVAQTATSSPLGLAGVAQMLLALVAVGAVVKLVLPRWLPSIGRLRVGSGPFGEINVLETRTLPNGCLHLVETRGRTLLIAANPSGASLIADLTRVEPEPVAVVEPTVFDSVLRDAQPRPPSPDVHDPAPIRSGVAAALDRLKTLTGR